MYLQTNNYYLFQSTPFGLQYSLLDDATTVENISGTHLQNVLQYSGQMPLKIRNIENPLFFYCNFHLREKPKVTGCQIWRIQRRVQLCNSFFSPKGANGQCIVNQSIGMVKEPIVCSKFGELFMNSNVRSLFALV